MVLGKGWEEGVCMVAAAAAEAAAAAAVVRWCI